MSWTPIVKGKLRFLSKAKRFQNYLSIYDSHIHIWNMTSIELHNMHLSPSFNNVIFQFACRLFLLHATPVLRFECIKTRKIL